MLTYDLRTASRIEHMQQCMLHRMMLAVLMDSRMGLRAAGLCGLLSGNGVTVTAAVSAASGRNTLTSSTWGLFADWSRCLDM